MSTVSLWVKIENIEISVFYLVDDDLKAMTLYKKSEDRLNKHPENGIKI